MSLGEREQQALDAIGDGLAASDSELASRLAVFSRLTAGEKMPACEKIRTIPRGPWRRPYRHAGARARTQDPRNARKLCGRPGRRQATLLLLPFLISIGLIALALVLNRSGREECPQFVGIACTGQVPPHPTRSGTPTQMYMP